MSSSNHSERPRKKPARHAEASRGQPSEQPQRRASDAVEHFFATCPRGLEPALAAELTGLGAIDARATDGGVAFEGKLLLACAVNMWSRLASRLLWQVGFSRYRDQQDIYDAALKLPWQQWFAVHNTLRVNVTAIRSPLTSLDFITLKIKDAVCDRFRNATGERPSVDTADPDVRIHAFLTADTCTFYIDTSGDALFKRGYRSVVEAPLRENLAAGLLRLAEWTPHLPLLDPFCGSGTIAIEAAMIACDIAPGLEREFGFRHLSWFDSGVWGQVRDEARERAEAGKGTAIAGLHVSDIAQSAVDSARAGAAAVGVASSINFRRANALDVKPPADSGLIVTNPPYGVRLGADADLQSLYAAFGDTLKRKFSGWWAYVLCGEMSLMKSMRLKPSRKIPLFNGAIECRLVEYRMVAGSNRKPDPPAGVGEAEAEGEEEGGKMDASIDRSP